MFDDVGDLENKEIIGLNYDYNWGLEYGWGCRRIDCFVVKGLVNGMDCCMDCCYRFFPSSFLIFWEKGNILEKKEKKKRRDDLLFRVKRKRCCSLRFVTESVFFLCGGVLEFWSLVECRMANVVTDCVLLI